MNEFRVDGVITKIRTYGDFTFISLLNQEGKKDRIKSTYFDFGLNNSINTGFAEGESVEIIGSISSIKDKQTDKYKLGFWAYQIHTLENALDYSFKKKEPKVIKKEDFEDDIDVPF